MPDWLRRFLMGGALVVAALSLFLAFDRGRDEPPVVRRGVVVRVFPEPSAVAIRQDAIGVELQFGYRASLSIDRHPIPDDQLDKQEGINRFSFTPGPEKEFSQLDEGRHCATVDYSRTPVGDASAPTTAAPAATTTAAAPTTAPARSTDASGSYTWCFLAA